MPSRLLKGIAFRADAAHSRGACEITDILEAVAAGKVREIAISREVGDSVFYHSLSYRNGKLNRNPPITSFMDRNPVSINGCELLTIRVRIDMHMADDVRIAGRKTVKDWKQFRTTLVPGAVPGLWQNAFRVFFEARLSSRYLKPVETLQASRTLDGEGFSILAFHCTLIEFLESTLQGLSYRYVRRKDPPLGQYEYSESGKLFAAFLSTRQPFCRIFDAAIATDFYVGVRCALLHQARTKNGWIVKAKGPAIAVVSAKDKIVYRNTFPAALLDFIESYETAVPGDRQLQEAFLRKFNSLCE